MKGVKQLAISVISSALATCGTTGVQNAFSTFTVYSKLSAIRKDAIVKHGLVLIPYL
jgi:hypothetical protein